jgi:hypothetical protein
MKYIDKGPGKEGAKTQGEAIANGQPLQSPLCLWASPTLANVTTIKFYIHLNVRNILLQKKL